MTPRAVRRLCMLAAAAAATAARPAAGDPLFTVAPTAIDLGSVELVAAPATATVRVGNAGSGPLKLLALSVLDGGTGAAADWTLTAGAPCTAAVPPICALGDRTTAQLSLAFAPRSIGVRDATLIIDYHDTADRSLAIPLHGIGSGPSLELATAPSGLDFGALPTGVAGALTLQVVNRGTRNLGDAALTIAPPGPPFSVSPAAAFAVSTTAPTPITITCTPAAGSFTASLELSAPDVAGPPIQLALRCTGDPAQSLVATPPAVLLGEVRVAGSAIAHVDVSSPGAPVALTSASLELAVDGLTVRGTPATTPATLDVSAAPSLETPLDDRVLVTPATGRRLAIPVTGSAVKPDYSVPPAVSFGTFCVQQPTAPRIVALTSTGSATIGLTAPVLQSAGSQFDLALVAPLRFPAVVAVGQRAFVSVTPKPRATAGVTSDDLIWTTDVAGATAGRTTLTATFLDDGGAIAPDALAFGQAVVQLDVNNARPIALQNCSGAAFQLDAPRVPAPFAIDSPSFPAALAPGEIAMFSVGFHPTQPGKVARTLSLTSPQLRAPLTVALSGEGIAAPGPEQGAPTAVGVSTTSFYACNCTTGDPSGVLAISLAGFAVLLRRPRARRRTSRPPGRAGE